MFEDAYEPKLPHSFSSCAPLLAAIKKVPQLKEYLKAKFSLKRGQYPHELKF